MKQINNNFLDIYYLTQDGKVFNNKTKQYLTHDNNSYKLKTKDNTFKKISLKKLYRIVYNKEFCIDNIEDLNGEEWKEIEETQGLYYVSNKGRVKSYYDYNAKILKPQASNTNYYRVDIRYNDTRNYTLIHKLVAQAFLPLPNNINYQIHHKDFNTFNNNLNNLMWVSPTEHRKIHRKRGKKENGKQCAELERNNNK